jgi:non-ribosomal peptide synthetase component E (peptide arylation enzyme)
MALLSPHQSGALGRLARGPLKYTVAGYTAATQANADMGGLYYSSQTIQALERRGFAKIVEPQRQRRNRRVFITAAGRRRLLTGAR